jgi:hypothetical protein
LNAFAAVASLAFAVVANPVNDAHGLVRLGAGLDWQRQTVQNCTVAEASGTIPAVAAANCARVDCDMAEPHGGAPRLRHGLIARRWAAAAFWDAVRKPCVVRACALRHGAGAARSEAPPLCLQPRGVNGRRKDDGFKRLDELGREHDHVHARWERHLFICHFSSTPRPNLNMIRFDYYYFFELSKLMSMIPRSGKRASCSNTSFVQNNNNEGVFVVAWAQGC